MSDFKKTSNTESSAVAKRRSFLKKSATGAVLASLPAQSVWGACSVSGAMSGNLSRNTDRHDCVTPVVSPGKSPKYWKDAYSNDGGKDHHVSDGFSKCRSKNKNKHNKRRECYRKHVIECCDNLNMELTPELYTGNFKNCKDALYHSSVNGVPSLEYCLAGVYLSSFFGFHNEAEKGNKSSANKKVNEILLYVYVKAGQGEEVDLSQLESICNFSAQHKTSYKVDVCHV
jgi:hypothetical protein